MIAIKDVGLLGNIATAEPKKQFIPNSFEIELIPSTAFVNATITTAFKNLLKRISNLFTPGLNVNDFGIADYVKTSEMFQAIGFSKVGNNITFQAAPNALDKGTSAIINTLFTYSTYQVKANIAFNGIGIESAANDIRGMSGSGLKKQHGITVTFKDPDHNTGNLNSGINTLNNLKNKDRLVYISTVPQMPEVRIRNNYGVAIKVRVKIEHINTTNSDGTGTIRRKFLNYFPGETLADTNETIGGEIVYTKTIQPTAHLDMNFENKIRGGNVVVEYMPTGNPWADASLNYFKFYIRGKNPGQALVRAYLNIDRIANNANSSYRDRFWFIEKLLRKESGTRAGDVFLHFRAPTTAVPVAYNNNTRGLPIFGPPKGYGLAQIDNLGEMSIVDVTNAGLTAELAKLQPGGSREYEVLRVSPGIYIDKDRSYVVASEEAWDWRKNIDKAINVIEGKIDYAKTENKFLDQIFESVSAWNAAHPNDLVTFPSELEGQLITYSGIRSNIAELALYNSIFPAAPVSTATSKSIFDAFIIKLYNGGAYLKLTQPNPNTKPVITIDNSQSYVDNEGVTQTNYYVRDVSNEPG